MRFSRSVLRVLPTPAELDTAEYCPEGCTIWSAAGHPIVSLPAEVDIANADLLRSALLEVCSAGPAVVADMTATSLLAAAGVGVLVSTGRQLQDLGGELRLVARHPVVLRVLNVLQVDRSFRIFASLPEALASACDDLQPHDRAA